ncbi:MAG: hypothetical protein H7A25_26545 [Leptospiraceae bacterium]|nr:hypothetical protein [Leptospiraceae bacterium]
MKINRIILLYIFIFLYIKTKADYLLLKNGRTIENVKVKIENIHVRVSHSNGKKELIKKATVKRLTLKPVVWRNFNQEEIQKGIYEKERIRVADALLENEDWVFPEL